MESRLPLLVAQLSTNFRIKPSGRETRTLDRELGQIHLRRLNARFAAGDFYRRGIHAVAIPDPNLWVETDKVPADTITASEMETLTRCVPTFASI